MKNTRRLPFQSLTKEARQNLIVAALVVFYAGQVFFDAAWNNYCGNLAIDYCAFWSAGKIANDNGYAQVYSLDQLWAVQKPIVSKYMLPDQYAPVPVPYLPVFIIPFQLFAVLDVISGFWVWTIFNIIASVAYLWFFIKRTSPTGLIKKRYMFLCLLSLPMFLDIFQGQVNVWLMICVGEFLRNALDEKPFRAGLWLGGLLLKPQILIFIIPALFFKRYFRIFYGFAASSLFLGLVSFLLGGVGSLEKLTQLLIGYSGGLPSNYPESMMNWRMIALDVNAITRSTLGWWIAIPCMVATFVLILYVGWFFFPPDVKKFPAAILGIFAATFLITWHSHFSMSILLIPILLYLASRGILPDKLFSFWLFVPPGLMLAVYVAAPFIKTGFLSEELYPFLNILSGMRGFIPNVYILWWTIGVLKQTDQQGFVS